MLETSFGQIAIVLAAAVVIGAITMLLKQPLIVGFIGVGILLGPSVLGVVGANEHFEVLAQLGIAVLLFLVGLKLDPQLIRTTGPVALVTGLGQVIFTSVIGYGLALLMGLEPLHALYVAVALTFSSTIIIIKLLSDKRELDELHGRIAVGFLIVQDIVVVIALILLTAVGAATGDSVTSQLLAVVVKGAAFLATLYVFMRWILPPVIGRLARNRELLILSAVAWAVIVAAAGEALGFSTEVGAFLAGFTLASTPYREAIASRLVGLRDFLLLFFFIDLGARLDLGAAGTQLDRAGILSAFVLIGNPLIVLALMGIMGYRSRTAFKAGLTVAQISEFSLILAALGLRIGHIDDAVLGLITAVGIITIGLSTYLILYSQPIYERVARFLTVFERDKLRPGEIDSDHHEGDVDAIVYGLGRHGFLMAEGLTEQGWRVLGVDIDPDALQRASRAGLEAMYGDAEDPEFAHTLPLQQVRWVASTVPNMEVNLALVHGLRAAGYEGQLALTAHTPEAARRLRHEEVDLVLSPFALLAEQAVERIVGKDDVVTR